jgi:hypothetical protein
MKIATVRGPLGFRAEVFKSVDAQSANSSHFYSLCWKALNGETSCLWASTIGYVRPFKDEFFIKILQAKVADYVRENLTVEMDNES